MKTVRTVAENWGFTIEYTKKVLEVFGVRVTDPDYIFNEEEIRRINDGVIRTHIAGNGMTVSELESQKKQDEQERIRQQMFRLEQERIAREELLEAEKRRKVYQEEQRMLIRRKAYEEVKEREQQEQQRIQNPEIRHTVSSDDAELSAASQGKLEYLVQNYILFIDTCSLLLPESAAFLGNLIPELKKHGKILYLPRVVYQEFERVKDNKPELTVIYKEVYNILFHMSQQKLLVICGDASDIGHADNVFLTQFTRLRMKGRMLLITQDRGLTADILNLNNQRSSSGDPILVQRINRYGYLSKPAELRTGDNGASGSCNNIYHKPVHTTGDNRNRRNHPLFKTGQTVTSLSTDPVPGIRIPEEGEYVFTGSGKRIILQKRLSNGGEGTIYRTNVPQVAKIYFAEKNNEFRRAKLERMVRNSINHTFVCWPEELLYNQDRQFVGYLMKEAKGLPLEQILGPIYIQEEFPDWTKLELIQLAYTIVNTIQYLHSEQIILGDINLNNFLVEDSEHVYFVDTDSYQIDEFPCPVGTLEYIPPELQHKDLKTVLRTMENENFSIATLVFMILMLGKKPYDKIDSEGVAVAIRDADFSYPLEKERNGQAPKGPWRFIWSHLSFDMKKNFYHTFQKDGEHYRPEDRFSSRDWKNFLLNYKQKYPKMLENDPESGLIRPNRFKRFRQTCKKCGKLVFNDELTSGICSDCEKTIPDRICKHCHKPIGVHALLQWKGDKPRDLCNTCLEKSRKTYTNYECLACNKIVTVSELMYEKYREKGKDLPRFCNECRNKNNEIYDTVKCSGCGEYFDINYKTMRYYLLTGNDLPKRCPKCRNSRTSKHRDASKIDRKWFDW
ncbi:MAG: hypothetical protein MR487_10360 [Lachnospiraceae bacterium]|nr:hypothetical protein [Lachnospiraceae bacterium]